jgi:uncharacterized protein (DUF3084 family)
MTTMYRKLLVGLAIITGMAISGSDVAANTVININSIRQCATISQIIPSICCVESGIDCADSDCKVIDCRIPAVKC